MECSVIRGSSRAGMQPRISLRFIRATACYYGLLRLAGLLIDFRLDEEGEIAQRFLSAEIACYRRNGVGNASLHDGQLGTDGFQSSSLTTCFAHGALPTERTSFRSAVSTNVS